MTQRLTLDGPSLTSSLTPSLGPTVSITSQTLDLCAQETSAASGDFGSRMISQEEETGVESGGAGQSADGENKDPFGSKVPDLPTQQGPKGVLFDFNDGARVFLPKGKWTVRIEDDESGNILFSCDTDEGWVVSTKKYYVAFRIIVWDRTAGDDPVLDHRMDLKDKPVRIMFPVGTLGDLIGWFHYAERFREKFGAKVECTLGAPLIELFKDQYPHLTLSLPEEVRTTAPYASYKVGLYFGGDTNNQPFDFRQVGLHKTAGYILGVDPTEEPPRVRLDHPRRIKERYVVIATKSSCQCKMWNNGYGWPLVVDHLSSLGYKVVCIDRDKTSGHGYVWNWMPHGVEDYSGNLPLSERVGILQHADFFIGLSSGLSWLAWAARVPVIMISGFTLPICEFYTPYRVYSTHGCKGCWDDTTLAFDHKDYFWCPRHKGTDRQFECTRLITGKQVIGHITRLMSDKGLAPPTRHGKSAKAA